MVSKAVHGVGAVLLLLASNCFMNTAWYLHLKFPTWPLYKAIFLSWGIAFFEYCLQVPANRIGHFSHGGPFTAPQLKVVNEFLSLSVFAVFSVVVLKEKLRWWDLGAFLLIVAGVAVGMAGKREEAALPPQPPPVPTPAAEPQAAQAGRRLLTRQLQLAPYIAAADSSLTVGGQAGETEGKVAAQAGGPSGAMHSVHNLQNSGSAQVVLADDADVRSGCSQAGMRQRDVTFAVEAGAGRPTRFAQQDGSNAETEERQNDPNQPQVPASSTPPYTDD